MPEQRARFVDPPFGHEPPDARAADDEVLVAHGIDLFCFEAVADPEHSQQREITRAIVAEQEIRAHPHLGDVEPVDEHSAHEHFRIPARELHGERHDCRTLKARARQRLEFLRVGHQQRRRFVGTDDTRRMRVEGHDDGRRAALAGDALHAVEDLAVPAVQAVEVSERQHRLRPTRRPRVVRKANDLHESLGPTHHKPAPRRPAGARRSPRARARDRCA